ncbi:MAG TPA: chlorite dismutase family protein, partial [Chthoniobacteraceae bacterium]|nr:chlorite dismutase family protein [Chthoniobacteraceae bacterium]
MTDKAIEPLVPKEGLHVLHLFYKIEHGQWQLATAEEQRQAMTRLSQLVGEIRATPSTQLLIFSMVSPKADIGFMLLTPDLHAANRFEKRLTLSLGPDVLTPVYSYLSLTEQSEYTSSDEELAANLAAEGAVKPGTPEFDAKMDEIRARMAKYKKDKLYPNLPDWPVFCFYPMSKR